MLAEIRLELLKVLIPTASRAGISDPKNLIDSCRMLESYVLESQPQVEEQPASTARSTLKLPRKDKRADAAPAFLTPPTGGQVDSSPR